MNELQFHLQPTTGQAAAARMSLAIALGLCAIGTLALAIPAQSRSGTYTTSFGTSNFGGTIDAYGSMSRTNSTSSTTARVSGYVRLLGQSREAGRVEVSGSQSYGSGSGSVTVRIGGATVWTSSLAQSGSRSVSRLLNVFPSPISSTYLVGPVPVTVSGNVGAGVQLNANWVLVAPTLSAGISGSARAWGFGTATAAIGVPGYNVGVTARLNFADHGLNLGMNVRAQGLSGFLQYDLRPIQLQLDLVLRAWPLSYTRNLIDWAQPAFFRTLL